MFLSNNPSGPMWSNTIHFVYSYCQGKMVRENNSFVHEKVRGNDMIFKKVQGNSGEMEF